MIMKYDNDYDDKDSAWFYSKVGFKNFIQRNADKSILVSEALQRFKEVRCLPARFRQMSLEHLLSEDVNQIESVDVDESDLDLDDDLETEDEEEDDKGDSDSGR